MARFDAYYDRMARRQSLNWAIALTVTFSFVCCISFFQFFKYFQQHDVFYMLVSPFNFFMGLAGTFQGVQITHAVVRRFVAEAREPVLTDN